MRELPDSLEFKGNNPGAVQHGNFINYYQFHPPEDRISLLPKSLSSQLNVECVHALDIGCNAGDLTSAIHDYLVTSLSPHCVTCNLLGIDIDPILIERANEKNNNDSIRFCCLDFVNDDNREKLMKEYFEQAGISNFGIIFCFSTTMWIHLNNGDSGLKKFLRQLSKLTEILVIEPQPWKCYKNAVKRMKLSNGDFPLFKDLEMRQTVEDDIENFLIDDCKFTKIYESDLTKWGRKLLVFKKCYS